MSSATDTDWGEGMSALSQVIDQFGDSSRNEDEPHVPPEEQVEIERRRELTRRWLWYRCAQYEDRVIHWDGGRAFKPAEEIDAMASGVVPPGFWVSGKFSDNGDDEFPLRFRKPSAPTHTARSIIQRFSGLLFGRDRWPTVTVPTDKQTENWLHGFIKDTRLWAQLLKARRFGGAMGSFAVGFKFVDGRPRIEVHDPRMTMPVFVDRETLELQYIDKQYIYEDVIKLPSGESIFGQFRYRRVITDKVDITWPRVQIVEGLEPDWEEEPHTVYRHDFGFVPVVWVQNIANDEDIDGDPDIHGIYDLLERVDMLNSQADLGAISNVDPTFIVKTDAMLPGGLRKGSMNAIQLPSGSDASYLELQGTSIKVAREMAKDFRDEALRVARVVLDGGDAGVPKTATEVMRRYSEMYEQVDILREQYGELCIRPLLEGVLSAARTLESRGQFVRLRPNEDGVARVLGFGEYVSLSWPAHAEPGLEDVKTAVDTAVAAKNGGILDTAGAVKFTAPYLKIEDPAATAKAAEEEMMAMGDAEVGSLVGENEVYPEDEDVENFGDPYAEPAEGEELEFA